MPSVSKKQHNFMEAVAHSAEFAKRANVPQSVGKEFAKEDATANKRARQQALYDHPRSKNKD